MMHDADLEVLRSPKDEEALKARRGQRYAAVITPASAV